MPKTAGNSFLNSLRRAYGQALRLDYGDMAKLQEYFVSDSPGELCVPVSADRLDSIACVHGHFLAAKYGSFASDPRNRFVTWLRDPLQRLCSHYYFWRRSYDPTAAGPLFRRVIEEDWSLEQFCLSEEYRNIYTKYLCGFPPERFDFIGIVERYEDDLTYLGERLLGVDLNAYEENRNTDAMGQYNVDSGLQAEIESFHRSDYELYRQALHARETRL
jgi:hypothetical protein